MARQEIDRFNKLLETIHTSLRALNRAIDGEIVMSESLERTFDALLQQKVSKLYVLAPGTHKANSINLTFRIEIRFIENLIVLIRICSLVQL